MNNDVTLSHTVPPVLMTVSFDCLGWKCTSDSMTPHEASIFANDLAQKGIPYTLNFS